MAKKKELDKLSLDMIQCKKDGFGVHYGKWKALQAEGKLKRSYQKDGLFAPIAVKNLSLLIILPRNTASIAVKEQQQILGESLRFVNK